MIMSNKHWMAACFMCAIAIASCTDSNYDLTDIDSQVRVEVNDFLVPTNVKDIKLEKILDIKEGDRIEKIGEDLYGVIEENTFESDVISIDPVNLAFSAKTEVNAKMTVDEKINIPGLPDKNVNVSDYVSSDQVVVNYGIAEDMQDVEFTAKNIDEHVKRLDRLTVKEVTYRVSLAFKGLDDFVNTYTLEGLKINLPKGLVASVSDGGAYDPKTGEATFPTLKSDLGLMKNIDVKITVLDLKTAGAKFENHNLSFVSELKAKGYLKVYGNDLKATINLKKLLDMESINYTLSGAMLTNLTVTNVTGAVRYDVDPINVNPIELKNLPDFLAQTGTIIDMKNPQLYLQVKNPIKQGVKPNVELSMTTTPVNSYAPFTVNMVVENEENRYCCSPIKPSDFIGGWSDAEWKEFKNFGKILVAGSAGNEKIPEEIKVVANAYVDQEVTDFELKSYGKVTGSYKFYAPIELTENSKIAYADSIKGWNDADLDKVTIRTLNLKGNVSTDIPAQIVTLTITPLIIKNGKPVFDSQSVTVDLKATDGKIENCPINCSFTKQIEHLDGIYIKANYNASGKDALRPSQNLKVKDLKVTVSGYYDDKF